MGLIRLRFAAWAFSQFNSPFFGRRGRGVEWQLLATSFQLLASCRGAAVVVYLLVPSRPLPPVWHTSVFDSRKFTGWVHTSSIPRSYLVHTSSYLSYLRLEKEDCLVERSWSEYAPRRGNYRQSWR